MYRATKVAVEKYSYGIYQGEIGDSLRAACITGYLKAEEDLGWHSVEESIPEIDEEVIVLTNEMHGKTLQSASRLCFGHRPNPNGWDGKDIFTGEVTHHEPVLYDGWNIPGVKYWMPCPKLPSEEEND